MCRKATYDGKSSDGQLWGTGVVVEPWDDLVKVGAHWLAVTLLVQGGGGTEMALSTVLSMRAWMSRHDDFMNTSRTSGDSAGCGSNGFTSDPSSTDRKTSWVSLMKRLLTDVEQSKTRRKWLVTVTLGAVSTVLWG